MTDRFFSCPACGEDVPAGAKACPDCGACEKSGWSDDAMYDALDLPEEAYEDEVQQDTRRPPAATSGRQQAFRAVVAGLLLLALFGYLFPGGCLAR